MGAAEKFASGQKTLARPNCSGQSAGRPAGQCAPLIESI